MFEGWFASSDDFDMQSGKGLVSCPSCGDAHVTRLPSGPMIKKHAVAPASQSSTADFKRFAAAVKDAMNKSEDVAERFAEEARKIHYGEADPRAIRGVATLSDAKELLEEGIPVLPLPIPDKGEMH